VGHRADLWNLTTKHTSLREELTKQLPLKETELLLKCQEQDWMLKE
jgi:hypothetical protein